jgi:NADH-quinone oxidoreductase subunit M
MEQVPILTLLVATPIVAAIVVGLLPARRSELALPVGIGLSAIPLALAGWLFFEFTATGGFQFTEFATIYEPLGVAWNVGVDGISMPLVVITAVLVPIALGASAGITDRTKLFVIMVLLLEAATIGVFVALDLLVFFVFFEFVLVPMTFIIGIWGSENRVYAAVKFFIYTAFGSALMLAGIIALVLTAANGGPISFAWQDLVGLGLPTDTQLWLFAAFALAFAIKVPLFPLHTWLPDAHVQAPTAGSVLLAGVLLKLGTYGLLRFNLPLFPEASVAAVPVMATLAVIGIIYGAAVAIVQPDLKKLVAYSSVSHLGFIVLGTFALTGAGLEGAVIQNVNHAITTGALFLIVGMLYERRHTKQIADYGGVAKSAPLLAGFFLFMSLASIGLPGLNGFVGEFLVLVGSGRTLPGFTAVAAIGVILAAIYLLWAYQRVFTGEPETEENRTIADLRWGEGLVLVPLAALVLVLGLYPNILLDKITPSTDAVIAQVEEGSDYVAPDVIVLAPVGDPETEDHG